MHQKYITMAQNKLRITQEDFLIANRRASRLEEIKAHGHPVISRTMTHKSKKVYDRKQFKRAAIKSDDSSYHIQRSPYHSVAICNLSNVYPNKQISINN